jgi:TPR repeat protein
VLPRAAWFFLGPVVVIAVVACSAEMDRQRNSELFNLTSGKAARGDRVAAMHLGTLYLRGIGTARDPHAALAWYEMGGPHGGWALIGRMYENGNGVAQDQERAASYYRRAAETGDAVAMYRLGCLRADDRVAGLDAVEGYMWLILAKTIGDSSGTCLVVHVECNNGAIKDRPGCRARLGAALTPAERGEAERRAADWLATRSSRKNA